MAMAMLLDIEKCIACRGCQAACKEWNDLASNDTTQHGTYQNPPTLNPTTYTLIEFIEHEKPDGVLAWTFFNKRCLHCTDAACVEVCPTEALKHDEMGFVSLENDLCNGCGYCVQACPFEIPKLDVGNTLTGRAVSTKCNFCQDRMHNDMMPACAKACPTEAIYFGEREDVIARGNEQVERLKAAGYENARLYGETELGGLGQMYVLPQTASFFGLPENPQISGMVQNWQGIVRPLGYLAVGATMLGLGANWITQRANRKIMMRAEEQQNVVELEKQKEVES